MTSNPASTLKKLAGFIDMKPKWLDILPMMLEVFTGGNASGRQIAREELERMAKLADAHVALRNRLDALKAEIDEKALGTQGPLAEFAMKLNGVMIGTYPHAKT